MGAKLRHACQSLPRVLHVTGALSNGVIASCAVLVLAPGDADALKARAVVLIQYDEFQQALDAIAADGAIADDLLFEKVRDSLTCRNVVLHNVVLGCSARALLDCQRLECKLPSMSMSHIRYAVLDDPENGCVCTCRPTATTDSESWNRRCRWYSRWAPALVWLCHV